MTTGDLFDSVTIDDKLHISGMPPVQLSILYASIEEDTIKFRNKMKKNAIDTSFLELGIMTEAYSIPPKEELVNTKIGGQIDC